MKIPYRNNNEISQSFPDGLVRIYSTGNTAPAGYRPTAGLIEKVSLRYAEQRLGINRLYLSRQNQIEIERVLRVPRYSDLSTQDVAITEDGKQYRIDTIQTVSDVWPPCYDISLTKVEQLFEVRK